MVVEIAEKIIEEARDSRRYSRHSEFIDPEEQVKLGRAKVLIAGCGAGSPLAPNLARLGIGTEGVITLADPDTVDVNNLNRQFYTEDDIGTNKAEALSKNIHAINHQVQTRVVSEGITGQNVNELVNDSDIIVDMVDVAVPEIAFKLHEEARHQCKPVVTGLDIGEGIIVYVFDYRNPQSMPLNRFFGLPDNVLPEDVKNLPPLALAAQQVMGATDRQFPNLGEAGDYYRNLLSTNAEGVFKHLPPEMHRAAQKLLTGELGFLPQINSAAALLGVTQSVIVKELILGHDVKSVPDAVKINLLEAVRP